VESILFATVNFQFIFFYIFLLNLYFFCKSRCIVEDSNFFFVGGDVGAGVVGEDLGFKSVGKRLFYYCSFIFFTFVLSITHHLIIKK